MAPLGSHNDSAESSRGGNGPDSSDSEFESFVNIDSPGTGGGTTSATPVEETRLAPEMVLELVKAIERAERDVQHMGQDTKKTHKNLDEMEAKMDELKKVAETARKIETKSKYYEEVEKLVMQNLKIKEAKGEDQDYFKTMAGFYAKVEELVLHNQNIELAKGSKEESKEAEEDGLDDTLKVDAGTCDLVELIFTQNAEAGDALHSESKEAEDEEAFDGKAEVYDKVELVLSQKVESDGFLKELKELEVRKE